MAFKERAAPEFAPFIKSADVFKKVGDKFDAIYCSQAEGAYGIDYVFNTSVGKFTLTLKEKSALRKQLEADGGLQTGSRVLIQFKGERDIGKENPMKEFKVAVDDEYRGAPPKNGSNVAPPQKPTEAASTETDYIPF